MQSTDPLTEAIAAEQTARDEMLAATDQAKAAQLAQQVAYRAFQTATRRRQMVYIQSRHRAVIRGVPLPAVATSPTNDPKEERDRRSARVRNAVALALVARGEGMLAIELAGVVGIPARAVRNYCDGDPRFVIDHVHCKDRDAVRVSLRKGLKK